MGQPRQLIDIKNDICSAIRLRDRNAIRRLMNERRPVLHSMRIASQERRRYHQAQCRLWNDIDLLFHLPDKDNICFYKKYNIYMYQEINTYKEYENYFKQRANIAQNNIRWLLMAPSSGGFRRAALLRSQSSIRPNHLHDRSNKFRIHLDLNTIKQIKSKDIPLSFTIIDKNDSNKNITFIVPYNYPFKPPKISINNIPLMDLKGKDDTSDTLIGLLTEEWRATRTIHKCIQLLETILM
jgi:hypothetical protein